MTLTPVQRRAPHASNTRSRTAQNRTGHRAVRRSIAALPVMVLLATLAGSTPPVPAGEPTFFVPAVAPIRYPRPTVTHLHYRHWRLDPNQPHAGLVMSDVQLWWNVNGTALIQRCDVVENPKSTRISEPLTVRGPCPDTWHLVAGQYRPRMPDPIPASTAVLHSWLATIADGNSDHALIAAVADMLREHHLNPQQRSALLTILADVTGLKYRGTTTDRAGRTGDAFTLDSLLPDGSKITDLLIIGDDGQLLGYDKVLVTPAPGGRLEPMTVIETIVYLESEMTSVIPGTHAVTCDQHTCVEAASSGQRTSAATPPAIHANPTTHIFHRPRRTSGTPQGADDQFRVFGEAGTTLAEVMR
jgi:hypothetical protein